MLESTILMLGHGTVDPSQLVLNIPVVASLLVFVATREQRGTFVGRTPLDRICELVKLGTEENPP